MQLLLSISKCVVHSIKLKTCLSFNKIYCREIPTGRDVTPREIARNRCDVTEIKHRIMFIQQYVSEKAKE